MSTSIKDKVVSILRRKKNKGASSVTEQKHDITLVTHAHKRMIPSLRQFLSMGTILKGKEKILFFSALIILIISTVWGGSILSSQYRIEVPAVGGDYTEGVIGSVQSINPLFAMLNDVDQDITQLVYSGLMRYDAQRRLVPDLAVKYDVSEDKRIYTFELKKDVLWHDGQPFTVDDVVYTFEMIQDEQVGSPLSVTFQGVIVERVDDYTVKFTLEEPFPLFVSSLTRGILPGHIWNEIPIDQMRLAKRNLQPIGTGPYMFERLVKDESGFIHRIEFKRFQDFYRVSSFVKSFAFEFFNEYEGPQGLVTALREQKIDGINFVPFEYREKVERKHITLHTLQLPQYTALFFNQDRGLIEDKNTRLALTYSLDKERIVHDILKNEGKVIHGPILDGFPGFNSEIQKREFSMDEANILLDESWERISADDYRTFLRDERVSQIVEESTLEEVQNNDESETLESDELEDSDAEIIVDESQVATSTVDVDQVKTDVDQELDNTLDEAQLFYRYPNGSEKDDILELTLVTAATPEYTKVAEIIAGYWQDIGIKVNIRFVDSKDMTREVLKTRDYDVLLYGIIIGSDPDQYPFWHSDQVTYPGLNLSYYINRSADELLETIRETDNEEELATLYTDLQNILLEDIPAAFLYTPIYTYALTDDIKGFDVDHISHPSDRFSNIAEWYIGTKKIWKLN
ncbi:hypothetical protein HOF40_02455 [Candidatus Parcubacteria bacterium]|nr:hypothetical protein [Candidatus Parcubacteria bacterium]MBT3948927.1 hypothetical protein [Candidatus Parcubacteria bacterium]